ncbi:hypothetical protein PV10_00476 [Exophiala mesophila]|uniref:Uncharacterized protein n=1 Tax=Exophiala mesophila TaxID=212818 RepID=A0A0D2ACG3_EXOME|nr:uncharacterized protein PV10_00476 [Exophiala mesophila]KIV96638.1 hypothetical protein PV10_00476 [Exophiala mesophila]
MAPKQVVESDKGLKSPLLSQAIVHNGTVYVSGNVGLDIAANKIVEGSTYDRSVQALKNIEVVLQEAGSSLSNLVKVNIYITSMENYAAVNKAYLELIPDPKPARTCVAVKELPFGTDVEIEAIAHL